jgi:hypothetical protein
MNKPERKTQNTGEKEEHGTDRERPRKKRETL